MSKYILLSDAIRLRDISAIEILIQSGTDVNTVDDPQVNVFPLHLAVDAQSVETIEVLIKAGADVNAQLLLDGYTALHRAARQGLPQIVEVLLKHGADSTRLSTQGYNPLHCAAWKGRTDVIHMLLTHSSPTSGRLCLDTVSKWGTPLHAAARRGHMQAAALLLLRGADPTLRNKQGHTPRDVATDHGMRSLLWAHIGAARAIGTGAGPTTGPAAGVGGSSDHDRAQIVSLQRMADHEKDTAAKANARLVIAEQRMAEAEARVITLSDQLRDQSSENRRNIAELRRTKLALEKASKATTALPVAAPANVVVPTKSEQVSSCESNVVAPTAPTNCVSTKRASTIAPSKADNDDMSAQETVDWEML